MKDRDTGGEKEDVVVCICWEEKCNICGICMEVNDKENNENELLKKKRNYKKKP